MATKGEVKVPTPKQCIRAKCLVCIGQEATRTAYDCLSGICPLYPCNPFRGRLLHPAERPPDWDEAQARKTMFAHHARFPKRQPSKELVAKMCRQCQPEQGDDCDATACPLYPWRPFQPGGQPTKEASEAQLAQVERLATSRARKTTNSA